MVACGLSAAHPPYAWPRAHTSGFAAGPDTGSRGTSRCSGRRGSGRGGGPTGAGRPGFAGVDGVPVGRVRAGVDAGAEGWRDGPTSSRASRAGACTTRGATLPSGRGSDTGGGGGGEPDEGGRWTVTQPETAAAAETATVTRSAAVVAVRCTRSTLLSPHGFGVQGGGLCPTRVNAACRATALPGTATAGTRAPPQPPVAPSTRSRIRSA